MITGDLSSQLGQKEKMVPTGPSYVKDLDWRSLHSQHGADP